MSTWTSSMRRDERGSGICLTTRITSSTLVLIDGGSRSLRRFVARLRKRLGRYHCLARRLLRRSRRASIFSFPFPRWRVFSAGQTPVFSTHAQTLLHPSFARAHGAGLVPSFHCVVRL